MTPNPRETAHMLAACALRREWETPEEDIGTRQIPAARCRIKPKEKHLLFHQHLNN
jgi:hypothetical protein